MRHVLIALLAIVLLTGCSASQLIRRAKNKNPDLFSTQTSIQIDTIIIEVPKILERIIVDTLVEIVKVDPITKIRTVIKYKIHNDTIMIDCPDQEVITNIITNTEIVTLEPTFKQKIVGGLYIGIGILCLFVAIFVVKKII